MSTPNSQPRSRSSSNASNGHGRPVPVFPPDTADDGNTENGASGQPLDEDSDNDARLHHPSSNARTQFTAHTPAAEKAAIQSLRTKMTFSDHSAPSSTASTPNKSHQPPFPSQHLLQGAMTDPSKLQQKKAKKPTSASVAMPQLTGALVNGDNDNDDQSDEGSEGEITNSVTISTLLSKLDSVRNFLKEAETLHKRFQDRVSEPGVAEQLAKLETLIAELKEQESSHLGVLLAVMAAGELKSGIDRKDLELSEDEESEDDGSEGDSERESDGENPANQTYVKATTSDNSLSLRAQIDKHHQQNKEQEEDLVVLKQQQELLKKLIAQQKQIQDLEVRQASLLKMKRHAEEQIAEAEAKTTELQQLADAAEEKKRQNEEELGLLEVAQTASEEHVQTFRPPTTTSATGTGSDDKGQDVEERMGRQILNDEIPEPVSISQERLLLVKLAELRARKQRVEQLVGLLSAMRLEDEVAATVSGSPRMTGTNQEPPPAGVQEEPSQVVSQTEAGNMIDLSAEATRDDGGGPSELVHDDEAAGMAELQDRLRKAEEARRKLRELQQMISQLHNYSPDNSEAEEEHTSPQEKFHWRDESGRGHVGVVSSEGEDSDDEEEEEEVGNVTMNTTLTEDIDPAEQTVVEQYEHRLAAKKQEVAELQRQRDELRKTHERLVLLQSQILTPKGGNVEVKPKSSSKIQSKKTKAEEKALNTTNATWGGSTITSENEGEKSPGSSVSLPSAILAELTHNDSTLPTASALAGSASVEQTGASQRKPPFKVTRHTPRNVPTQRFYRTRTISSPTDQAQRKRRKLDSQNLSKASWHPEPQEQPRPTNPNPYTAGYFQSPQQQQQQPQLPPPNQLDTSHMTTDSTQYHTSMMYSQLALTSNMCSELLHTQSSLICAMCSHMEMFRYQTGIHQHYSALCQYQKELEQYYQDLYRSYSQMFQHHSAQQAGREDDDQFPSAGTQTEPEDPVMGSMNEQQFEGTQGSTGIASSPTAVGVGLEAGGEMAASGDQLGEATPRMPPPPPPLSSQPLPFLVHGYSSHQPQQQPGGGDISFTTASAEVAASVSASGGVNPTTLPAPPIPPPSFNPYHAPFRSPYHMNPYNDSSPMSRPVYGHDPSLGSSFGPSFPHGGGFSTSPLLRPNHLPGYPYRSPVRYPHHYHHPQWDHQSPSAAVFGSPASQGAPQFAPPFPPHPPPPGVPTYPSLFQPLPPLAHPPFSHLHSHVVPPPPSHFHPPAASFNASLVGGAGLGNLRPTTLLSPQAQLHGDPFSKVGDRLGFHGHSPSGITAASLQVQPPSSPPSAPSVNLQPSSSNQNNCNATSTAMPNFGTTDSSTGITVSLPNPTSMGGTTLQFPSFPLVGGTKSTPALAHASYTASYFKTDVSMGPGSSNSLPTLVVQPSSNLTKEAGAASLLAQRGHYGFGGLQSGAMATAPGGGTVEGEQGAKGGHQLEVREEESVSSLPVSIPEELSHLQLDTLESELLQSEQQEGAALTLSDLPSGFSVFDALRDTIYSEVATLIANNESRPHFLVELFRELQMLTTDYLRQRALYNLQDLVTRFLTEEGVAEEAKAATTNANMFQGWAAGSVSEHTPSDSGATTEDETAATSKPPLNKSNSQKYDYIEPVHSASSLSTPPNSSFSDEPFASENLGATAVRLDKTMAKIKGEVAFGSGGGDIGLKPPVTSPGPLKTDIELSVENVNTDQLDELIKVIMIEVIPIFKENLESICTAEILAQIKQTIMSLIKEQEEISEQKQEFFEAFTKQLETAINSAADKHCEKQLKECGEDLLVDISEVLFNELTFFRLLKDFKGHPQLNAEMDSMTSQSTTENEEEGEDKAEHSQTAAAADSALADTIRPLDPTLLQALSLVANANLAEEEEALGKSRDDDLATSWDTKMQERDRSSMSTDEDILAVAKVVELSLSESQPFNSTGSGEEDNLENGIDRFVIIDSVEAPPPSPPPTSSNDDHLRETTLTPPHGKPLPSGEPEQGKDQPPLVVEAQPSPSDQHQESANKQQVEDGVAPPNTGGETPPTPQTTDLNETSTNQNEVAALSGSIQPSGEECVEDKTAGINTDDGDGSQGPRDNREAIGDEKEKIEQAIGIGVAEVDDGEKQQEAVSPPATGSLGQQVGLAGINEAVLEAQMKVEQQSTEGVAGILASIDESEPIELVGDENELTTPTPEYVEP